MQSSGKDQRRNNAPEKTMPYSLFQTPTQRNLIDSNNRRIDTRLPLEARKMFMSVGIITQAKGSSYVEVGNTKLICAVYGPKEVPSKGFGADFRMIGQVSCEVNYAPFSCSVRKSPLPDRRQKEMCQILKDALEAVIILEKFPKAQINIFVTVIEDGGSLLSTCLTAAGLALCHGNIDVYDIVVGVSMLWNDGILYVDPTSGEEEARCNANSSGKSGSLVVGMMPQFANGQVTMCLQDGRLSSEVVCEGLTLAAELCQGLSALLRQVLQQHVEKTLEEVQDSSDSEIVADK